MKRNVKAVLSILLVFALLIPCIGFAADTPKTPVASSHHIAGLADEPVYDSNVKVYIEGKLVDFTKTQEIKKVDNVYKAVTVNNPILTVRGRTMMPLRAFVYYITDYVNQRKGDLGTYTNPGDIIFWEPYTEESKRPDGFKIDKVRYSNSPEDNRDILFGVRMLYIQVDTNLGTNNKNGTHGYHLYKADVPPLIMDDGVTYLPLRAEANTFGYGVKFDEKNNSVYISKNLPIQYGNGFKIVTEAKNPKDYKVGDKAFNWGTGTLDEIIYFDGTSSNLGPYVEPWK